MATEDLTKITKTIWNNLEASAGALHSPLGAFAFATIAAHGPSVRMVVLRRVDKECGRIFFCSDARSAKISELGMNSAASALFYERQQKFQLRIFGHASVHRGDDIASEIWRSLSLPARGLLASEVAPGTVIPGQKTFGERVRAATDRRVFSDQPISNFVAIGIAAETIDYLDIKIERHRRAVISVADPNQSRWIQP